MIYLDNAATTKPSRAAAEAMLGAVELFANPSSLYSFGLSAEKAVNAAKAQVAARLNAEPRNIYFTSGGTEGNNTVIFGAAQARRRLGNHLITTRIEHPSVLEAFKKLERDGFSVTYIAPDRNGRIRTEDIKAAANENTILISVMHVNNETGVIQPVEEIRDAVLPLARNVLIHSDCVQSFCKLGTDVKKLKVDFATVSSHKIHGFKGTGAVYIADKRYVRPLLFGGEQQEEIRPGTENTGGIFAFGAAAAEAKPDAEQMRAKREHFKNRLLEEIPDIRINGSDEFNSGSILNASFVGLKAEILLHALEARGVYVSTGSACSSHKPQPSHVLDAMGLTAKEIGGAIRFSIDSSTTPEELERAVKIIKEEAANIRR